MALFEDLLKRDLVTSLAVGLGAAILAPAVLPSVLRMSKPVLKAAIKSGIIVYQKGRETAAELGEVFEDIVAEARAELERPGEPAPAGAGEQGQNPPPSAPSV
jgi:hypothetical protein